MNTKLNEDAGLMYISESVTGDKLVSNMDVYDKNKIFYVTFDTNLQSFDVINRNQRMYKADNIWECIQQEKIQCLLRDGCWFGEFDHPTPERKDEQLSPERIQNVPPVKRTFKIMNPKLTGNLLQGKIQSAQTDIGIGFAKEILAGWKPSFSCRAIATLKLINNKPTVVVRRLITYDAVWYPSHKEAHAISSIKPVSKAIKTVTESVNDIKETINGVMIPLKEILESIGKTDVNTQMIMESFDLPMESLIGVDNSHRHAIIKDKDNMIYANISPETKHKVDDFFSSFNI
jgi:hypothetical protein